jgi:esterase
MSDRQGEVLAHTVVGEGPREVVLLHGFLGSGQNLRGLARRWGERAPARFLIPDLRGHGTSPRLTPDSDLDQLAADVIATAAAAGFTPPLTLVGHSLGGRVALAAARRAPDQTKEVVLLDITPGAIDPEASESRGVLDLLVAAPATAPDRRTMRAHLMDRGLSGGLADWLLMNLEPDPDGGAYRWRFDRQAFLDLHERFTREDLWPVIDRGEVPVQVIRGGRSRYVSDADAARLQAAGVPVDTLEGAGHHVHVEALDALVDVLARQ